MYASLRHLYEYLCNMWQERGSISLHQHCVCITSSTLKAKLFLWFLLDWQVKKANTSTDLFLLRWCRRMQQEKQYAYKNERTLCQSRAWTEQTFHFAWNGLLALLACPIQIKGTQLEALLKASLWAEQIRIKILRSQPDNEEHSLCM